MFPRATLLLLGAVMLRSVGAFCLRGQEIKATSEQTAKGMRMARSVMSISNIERARLTLQAEQASMGLAALARIASNSTTQSLESQQIKHLHNFVSEGWSLVRATAAHDCHGSPQTVMGFKLGECTDLYISHMWVSYMQICDRTGQGYAQYSSVNTATYLGKGCTGPSL
ncbi:hypothetical protein B484DRAFT_466529, partial [Ochromonadaceae sp. CCMP2298]